MTTGRHVRASAVLDQLRGPDCQALLNELRCRGAQVDEEIALLRALVELEPQRSDLDDLAVIQPIREACLAISPACLVKVNLDRRRSFDVDRVLLPMIRDLGRAAGSFAGPGHQVDDGGPADGDGRTAHLGPHD